jgi:ATP-dependent helicase YprA (DUF1998 family)
MMYTPDARRLANARNAQYSTGPRSEDGKRRSSMNALKHGLTAAQAVLATEDPARYQATHDRWLAFDKPTDPAHEAAIEVCVSAKWRLDRCTLIENQRADQRMRHAGAQYDLRKFAEAELKGRRLIDEPINRCDVAPTHDPVFQARVKKRLDDNPAILVRELQMSTHGLEWLIVHWSELGEMLRRNKFWHYPEKFRAVWMLGKNPHEVIEDKVVQKIFLACNVAHPEVSDDDPEMLNLWDECHQARIGLSGRPMYIVQVEKLKAMRPPDAVTAQSVLLEIVANELARLGELKKKLEPIDRLDREAAVASAMFDDSEEGVLLRRYRTACEREYHKALADLMKIRKARATGPDAAPEVAASKPEAAVLPNEATAESPSEESVMALEALIARYQADIVGSAPGNDSRPTPSGPNLAPGGPVPVDV